MSIGAVCWIVGVWMGHTGDTSEAALEPMRRELACLDELVETKRAQLLLLQQYDAELQAQGTEVAQ